MVQGICASPWRAGRAGLWSRGNTHLWFCALQPAGEEAGVRGLGRPEVAVSAVPGLGPHPWPVHSWSSAIHELSCCSSPTSKMMSVRSFTWWGGRGWLCGIPGVCPYSPRGGKLGRSPLAQRCRGCQASRGVCTAGPPGCWSRLLVAWALNSRKPRRTLRVCPCWPFAHPGLFFCLPRGLAW